MKHTKTVDIPATTKEVVDKVTCDLCGAEIDPVGYNVEMVEIRCRTGSSYPEGGSGEETEVDMCAGCFESKLIPWLRSQGADPKTKDWWL